MAVATERVARKYLNVVASVAIPVDFPVFEVGDVKVYYGRGSNLAVYNVDYTLALDPPNFNTFTVTPLASLIAKINALIVADPTETNFIVVRRVMDFLTVTNEGAVRDLPFLSRELDRTAMRFAQQGEQLQRAIKLSPKNVDQDPQIEELVEDTTLLYKNGKIVAGPTGQDVANAQANAAIALTKAAEAAASAVSAAASAGQAALFDGPWLADVAALLANTSLTYAAGTSSSVAVGGFVRTRAEGFSYRVAAAAAADHHIATAGGVKLYVLAGASGYNAKAFGAIGDGAASNNAALLAAAAIAGADLKAPSGRYASTLTSVQIPKRILGVGQVGDADGYRAANFVRQDAAPSVYGAPDNIETRFNGDLSNLIYAAEKRITAVNAFGAPVTGYTQFLENSMFHLSAFNVAGHNESLSGNGGRTGSSMIDLRFQHNGQGDYGAIHVSAITTATKAGATSFLASPAAVMMNGELFSGANGSYLNILELNANDLGFRTAAIGAVFNFTRANAAATLGEVWMGVRPQSPNLASDVGYSLGGNWKRGLDLSDATLDGNAAAITLKQGQRIYMSAVASGDVGWSQAVGDDYLSFNGTSILTVVNGQAALQVNRDTVVANVDTAFLIAGTGTLSLAGADQFGTGIRTATFTATNKPGANNSGPTQWLRVRLNGFNFYIPCFPD